MNGSFIVLLFIEFSNPFSQFVLQQCLVGQVQRVLLCVDIGIFGQGQFDQGIVGRLAHQYAYRGLLKVLSHISVVIVYLHLHLSKVLMREIASLEVNQDIALQETIVEHQVDIEVSFLEGEPLLPSLEQESFAQFQ